MEKVNLKTAISGLPVEVDLINSMEWVGNSCALFGCVIGCYFASKFFQDDQYLEGKVALAGAFLCGIAPRISTAIMQDLI